MTAITVVQNDKLYNLNFTLKDANDNAYDLTNGTPIVLKAQKETGTALAFSGNIAVGTATTGECYYTVQSGDFSEAGRYYAEIEATFTGGKVITFHDIIVIVKPELPRTI